MGSVVGELRATLFSVRPVKSTTMRRLVPLVLLLAACNGEGAISTTTGPEERSSASVTSTTVEESTTTTVPRRADICRGRAELWDPDVEYVAECFVVPVGFVVSEEGWRSRAPEEDWVFVSWVDPEDRNYRVNAAVTALPSDDTVEARIDSIVDTTGISLIGEPASQSVAGFDATVVDVEGVRRSEETLTLGGRECSTAGNFVLQGRDEEGYFIASGPQDGDFFGVGACQVVRLWVFGVDDFTVTIIGGTADPTRHEEAVAKIEELFEGMVFDFGSGR